jgi:hypothetical protein
MVGRALEAQRDDVRLHARGWQRGHELLDACQREREPRTRDRPGGVRAHGGDGVFDEPRATLAVCSEDVENWEMMKERSSKMERTRRAASGRSEGRAVGSV